MTGKDVTRRSIDVAERTRGGDHLAWRPTWPFGGADDFVADLPRDGWARVRRIAAGPHAEEWRWSIDGADERAAGWEGDRDDAMSIVDARVFTH